MLQCEIFQSLHVWLSSGFMKIEWERDFRLSQRCSFVLRSCRIWFRFTVKWVPSLNMQLLKMRPPGFLEMSKKNDPVTPCHIRIERRPQCKYDTVDICNVQEGQFNNTHCTVTHYTARSKDREYPRLHL